jgi:hypothetical protein
MHKTVLSTKYVNIREQKKVITDNFMYNNFYTLQFLASPASMRTWIEIGILR